MHGSAAGNLDRSERFRLSSGYSKKENIVLLPQENRDDKFYWESMDLMNVASGLAFRFAATVTGVHHTGSKDFPALSAQIIFPNGNGVSLTRHVNRHRELSVTGIRERGSTPSGFPITDWGIRFPGILPEGRRDSVPDSEIREIAKSISILPRAY